MVGCGRSRMKAMSLPMPPVLQSLPDSLPMEGAVSVVLEEGIPIFRASQAVQDRIETLLAKQTDAGLTAEESVELDCHAETNDSPSFVNRIIYDLKLIAGR